MDDAALARLFADGCTLVLQGLHRLHAPLIDFAQQLGADLGHPVQVNAYVTPAQNQGFSDHYDVHDVFVLQVAGQKRWRIHDPVHRHPLRDQPWTDRRAAVEAAAGTHPSLDVVLGPGDALYLPAGYLHAAQALGQVSAHLTVGVHTWNRMHLVQQALSLLGDDEQLRAPLPLGVDVTDPSSLLAELQRRARRSPFGARPLRSRPDRARNAPAGRGVDARRTRGSDRAVTPGRLPRRADTTTLARPSAGPAHRQ